MREKIVCEACRDAGFENRFKAITHRHLTTHHNMTLDEYVERWPDAPLRGKDDKWIRKADVPEDIVGIMSSLREVQQQYIVERAKGLNKATAARSVGLAPSTVYTWKELPLVEQIISYMQFRPLLVAQTMLQQAVPDAVGTMIDLLVSPDDSIAQRASADIQDRSGLSRKPNLKIDLNFELWPTERLDNSITERLQEMGEIVEAEFEEID